MINHSDALKNWCVKTVGPMQVTVKLNAALDLNFFKWKFPSMLYLRRAVFISYARKYREKQPVRSTKMKTAFFDEIKSRAYKQSGTANYIQGRFVKK